MRTYPEQHHAEELYRILTDRFSADAPTTRVSLDGAGLRWTCHAEREGRRCDIACFDTSGPEFLSAFVETSAHRAWGRTSSKREVLGAVEDWLGEVSLSELHERYPFVDHKWRFLKAIERQIVRLHPDLDDPESHEIRPLGCDLCELRIRVADRSVSISFEGKEPVPRSYFEWDDCRMFRISWSDMDRLATVVHRWVQQRHNPSALQREYFDIKPNPVAHFYESGKPIEGEFLLSWGEMERFYAESRFIQKERALWVIAMVRRSGLDRTLRAGGSLWDLIVSRSRRHGLRPSQPFVAFSFSEALLKLHVHVDGDRVLDLPTSQLNDEQIVGELRRLTLRAID